MLGVARHVLERQNCDRGFVGQFEHVSDYGGSTDGGGADGGSIDGGGAVGFVFGRPIFQRDPIDPNGLVDVLDPLLAQIREFHVDFAFDVIENGAGNADAAGIGKRLQAGGHVDPVAVDVRVLDDDVPEVDPDSEPEALFPGLVGLAPSDGLLDIDGTLDGLDDAGKLG